MAKRAKPAWGNLGVVCIRGHGQTDDQLIERGIVLGEQGRGDRGCLLSDAQFKRLAAHLKVTEPTLVAEVREHLDVICKFYLRGRLYEAASPTQAERNAALAVVKDHIGAFCAAVDALEPLPEWSLLEPNAIEDPSPFCMFMSLPERLCVVADIALESVTPTQSADGDQAARLRALSERAMVLAAVLCHLDHASQADVISRLPWTREYDMDTFAEVVRLTQKLGDAVSEALAAGRRRGGPHPFHELCQAVAWLREVYEHCGGAFTHTPRAKTDYDGTPHSAAGRFVLDFFAICDPELRVQSISSAMAAVISGRRAAT
jgi:hypothetical protein